MGKFLVGLILGLIALPILGAIYFLGGYAPAAVLDRPIPFERVIAGGALEARIRREAPKRDLSSFSTVDILAGAQTYRRGCGGCHGLPEQTRTFPPPKMYPGPPQLFTPDGKVTDDPVGVTYWKIKNGIRLSGMPSFGDLLTDDQTWQVAALLASVDKLPAGATDILEQPLFPPAPASSSTNAPPAGAPGAEPTPNK
jgi:thiosulfate dehydrogenase